MSADLLAKLRVKNQPVKIESVEVIVKRGAQRQPLALKTKIEDKRDTTFNRELFLDAIAQQFQTIAKIPKPTAIPKPIPQKTDETQQDAAAIEQPKKITKKPKKLKKKLKRKN